MVNNPLMEEFLFRIKNGILFNTNLEFYSIDEYNFLLDYLILNERYEDCDFLTNLIGKLYDEKRENYLI